MIDSYTQEVIKNAIRTVPNFPKEGIMFRDISTLLANKMAFKLTINALMKEAETLTDEINYVAAIEARGFIFGSILADRLGKGFLMIRKPNKLPALSRKHDIVKVDYKTEYSEDSLEMDGKQHPRAKILVVDDLLATGGSAKAAGKLLTMIGAEVAAYFFVVELPELRGKDQLLGHRVTTLIQFDGT